MGQLSDEGRCSVRPVFPNPKSINCWPATELHHGFTVGGVDVGSAMEQYSEEGGGLLSLKELPFSIYIVYVMDRRTTSYWEPEPYAKQPSHR